jgi:two-component system, response regulator YesN
MRKILIVDDNVLFRRIVKEALWSRFDDIKISEVNDGEKALKEISTFLPDLILMDIRLPGENGLQLAKQIKAQQPDISVVILTSYDEPEYRDAAYRCKADHYVPKDTFLTLINSNSADELFSLRRKI